MPRNFKSAKYLICMDQCPLDSPPPARGFLKCQWFILLWTQWTYCLPGSADVLVYNYNILYSNSWEHVPETYVICQVRVYKDGMGERIQMEEQHSYLPEESLRKPYKWKRKKKFLLPIISPVISSLRPKAKWWVTWPIVIRIYHYDLILFLIGPEAGNSRNLPSKRLSSGILSLCWHPCQIWISFHLKNDYTSSCCSTKESSYCKPVRSCPANWPSWDPCSRGRRWSHRAGAGGCPAPGCSALGPFAPSLCVFRHVSACDKTRQVPCGCAKCGCSCTAVSGGGGNSSLSLPQICE